MKVVNLIKNHKSHKNQRNHKNQITHKIQLLKVIGMEID